MVRQNRPGLTRMEVVVLIVVLGFLLALMVPGINDGHPPARRAQCMNNQSELSKALQQFEMAKQHFPGYVNNFGEQWNGSSFVQASARNLSWTVVCLPYLGREDLWRQWRAGTPTTVKINQFVCPSDLPNDPFPTSYVANCGRSGQDGAAFGVFHDHMNFSPQDRILVSAANIPDGAQTTLMISENVSATEWNAVTEAAVGMVWWDAGNACRLINGSLDNLSACDAQDLARPSGYHPGGVIVSFCDGHQYFLREDIDYRVYQHLMTPDSAAAGVAGELKESEY